MSTLSKILNLVSTDLSCHELCHTWTPSCTSATAGIFRSCFLESLRIYGILYMVGGVLRRAGVKYFKDHYLKDVLRSSLFLAANGGGFVASICLLRKFIGSFNYFSVVYLPALMASCLSILIEKKSRRSTLALYMTNLAVETSFNMLKERRLFKPIPNGEIIIFCTATATMMYLYRKKGSQMDGLLNALIRFFLGSDDSRKHQEGIIIRDHSRAKWLQPTSKAFCTGYLIQLVPVLLGHLKYLTTRPGLFFRSLINKDCFACGLFLGSFVAIFKVVEWVLGLLRKKTDEINALVAGGLAGLSMMFYKSSTIALYVASKMFEFVWYIDGHKMHNLPGRTMHLRRCTKLVVYNQGTSAGIFPSIPHAVILTYSLSTALLFHSSVWEVQCVRPSYWRYLNVVTAKSTGFPGLEGDWAACDIRLCEINRKKADEVFGTESARFFPKDDLYFSLRRR